MEAVPNIKDRIAAFGITTLLFASLLLFLFYYLIITPLPIYPVEPEITVDINFGGGGGEMGLEGMGEPDNSAVVAQANPTTPISNENVFSANVGDPDVSVKEDKKTKKNDKSVVKKQVEKEEQPSQELLDFMKNVNKKLSKSSGESTNPTGTGSGDHGTGLGEGDNPNGHGGKGDNDKGSHGTGTYQLSGRKLLKRPDLLDESQEEGIVVVEIVVDQSGRVIDAIPGQRGSTTTSAYLYTLARQAAKTAKFSSSDDGVSEQHGTITIVFKLQ